jgi:lipopolysaccharide export LptBFGC system permease protein LptF
MRAKFDTFKLLVIAAGSAILGGHVVVAQDARALELVLPAAAVLAMLLTLRDLTRGWFQAH